MPTHHTKSKLKKSQESGTLAHQSFRDVAHRYLPANTWLRRTLLGVILLVIICFSVMYGIAVWYARSVAHQPLTLGVSFIPDYAQSLGVDPQETMDQLLAIDVTNFRLVSYWSDGEAVKGVYNFDQLDWQFKKAEAAKAKIILTVGLRQPRWPECHIPDWALNEPKNVWQPQLFDYMTAVINRYKDSPSLQSYQLENEYFLKGFGTCRDFSRQRLIDEYNLVAKTDPNHPIIVGRSNNALGTPIGKPTPDMFSISVYKRVWDAGVTHRYLEYPFPAWYYGFVAGVQKMVTGKDMIIGELQAEAWPPRGQTIPQTSLAEQNKSMNAVMLADRFDYGKATGMRGIYMWGAEYWYYRMVVLHDPSLWNVAKQEFARQR